jgi:hypothetical protein
MTFLVSTDITIPLSRSATEARFLNETLMFTEC